MNKRIKVLFVVFFWLIFQGETLLSAQNKELYAFGSNPGNLRSYLYSPTGLDQAKKYPLVVVLHGCSQNAKQVGEQSGWNTLADSNQFYVLYPEQKLSNNVNRCFNWFLNSDIEKGKGEAESVYQMIRYVQDSLNIDSSQVFIYGLSAGAAMSLAVMSCYPDEFKCGAVLAGGAYKSIDKPWEAPVKMRFPDIQPADSLGNKVREQNPGYAGEFPQLIVLHGLRDMVVNPENSNEIVKQWLNVHGADDIPDEIVMNYDNKENFARYEYFNDHQERVVIKYTLKDLSHKLPVDPGTGYKQGGKWGLFAEDANLFSTWYIAQDFGLVK